MNAAFCTASRRARSAAEVTIAAREASRAGVGGVSVMAVRVAFMRAVTEVVRAVVPGERESAERWRIERVVERQWFSGSSESAFSC